MRTWRKLRSERSHVFFPAHPWFLCFYFEKNRKCFAGHLQWTWYVDSVLTGRRSVVGSTEDAEETGAAGKFKHFWLFPANGDWLRRVPPANKTNIVFKGQKVKGVATVGAGSAQFVSLTRGAQRRASLLACRCYRGALALASDFLTDVAVRWHGSWRFRCL